MSLAELRPAATPGGVPAAEELIGRARKRSVERGRKGIYSPERP